MQQYGADLPTEEAKVGYVTLALEGEEAEWILISMTMMQQSYTISTSSWALKRWFRGPLADRKARIKLKSTV